MAAPVKLTLTSNAVAYSLITLARAQVKNFPLAPSNLSIQLPDNTFEAANDGATLKIGRPDSIVTPTDVTAPELVLGVGENKLWPGPSIDTNKYLKGSVNNQVVYVGAEG
jgi:hypothetical protein